MSLCQSIWLNKSKTKKQNENNMWTRMVTFRRDRTVKAEMGGAVTILLFGSREWKESLLK